MRGDAPVVDTQLYVEYGERHLAFRDDTPYPVWAEVVKWLRKAEKSIQWWIGDALRFGERRYGETYAQALEETDYEYGSLANMAYVAGKVEVSRRRENLSFAHHQVVAPLPPEEQERWLAEAAPEDGSKRPRLSSRELESRIAGKEPEMMEKCPTCNGRGRIPVRTETVE